MKAVKAAEKAYGQRPAVLLVLLPDTGLIRLHLFWVIV